MEALPVKRWTKRKRKETTMKLKTYQIFYNLRGLPRDHKPTSPYNKGFWIIARARSLSRVAAILGCSRTALCSNARDYSADWDVILNEKTSNKIRSRPIAEWVSYEAADHSGDIRWFI